MIDPSYRFCPSCGGDLEARLVTADEIPWGELAFESTHDALRAYLAGRLFQF